MAKPFRGFEGTLRASVEVLSRSSSVSKKRPRTVFTGKLLTVTQSFSPKGERSPLHETVHHPGSCVILPLLNSSTLLLLRQFRPSIGKVLWEVPAGTLEPGESPQRCAKREVEEETGYRAGRLRRLTIFYPSPGFCTEKMYLFLAEGLEPFSQTLEPDEKIRVHALSFQKAFQLLRQGKIRDAKTLIALYILRNRQKKRHQNLLHPNLRSSL